METHAAYPGMIRLNRMFRKAALECLRKPGEGAWHERKQHRSKDRQRAAHGGDGWRYRMRQGVAGRWSGCPQFGGRAAVVCGGGTPYRYDARFARRRGQSGYRAAGGRGERPCRAGPGSAWQGCRYSYVQWAAAEDGGIQQPYGNGQGSEELETAREEVMRS